MGNTDSTSAENDFTPLFHGKELKWKTGPLDTSIPINESYDVIDTYEKLKTSKKFKEYMLQHIDSDELIRSLLSNDSDEAALEGITSYNSPKPEDVETIAKEAKNLENCSNAGIKLKLSEVLQLLERQLGSSFQLERLPFLISIQRRLAVFRELHAAVSHERKSLVCSEKQRKWSKKSLNSIDHPSLSALSAFTDFGAEILDFIPLLVESLKDQEQVGNAVRPLINLCNKFSECEDLCFFSSWSPRVEPPLKSINLSKCVVNASRGDALLAIDGIANTRWSSEGGEWSITFASPEEIDRIRIAWVNPEGKILDQFGIGAPEKLSIFAVYEEQKEVSKPSFVTIIEPEKQKILQGSWIQYYKLNLKNVKKLILYPTKKICASSTATATEIFDFSAFNTDQNITWIDNLKLFSKIQRSFFSSMNIRSIESEALNANLGVLRGTGSLGLCLSFVEHFLQATPLAILTYDPFSALLKAISHKEDEVVKKFNRRNCKFVNEELNDCQFSTTKRSSNIVVHSKTEISIGNESGFCCIDTRLSLIFSEYSYDWEFQVTEGKGIRFGVTELSGSNPATLDKSWLVDLDGNLYIKSANSSSKLQVSRTQATNFRFLFIAKSRQLSLWIDEEYFGVIFEQIQGVVHPVVFFEAVEDHRSISLSKFVQIINPNSTVPTLSSSELTSFPLESTVNFAAELLDTISKLAEKLNLTLIYTDETESKQFLEYPFCAEVSFDLFGKLARVLGLLLDQNDDIGVQSLLKILELQFHILSKSNLRLASVESFFNEDVNENERENILQDLQLYLNRLTGSSNDSLAASATLTYSRGLRTFSKDNSEWLQKVVDLFERKSSLSYQLWGILLEGFDDLNTIKVLLDSLNDYDSKNLQRLTSQIINQVVNVELGMIKEKETCTSDKSEFLSISKSFLLFLLGELTVRIASNVDLKEITFADEVFIHLTKEMFLSSFQLLKSERVRAVSSWEHDLLLRQSFICNTLHSLIYVFSIETVPLKILELIIDDIQSFVLQMSELTNSSDICRHSLESVSSSIIRKRTHTSTGSSVGGWKVVKAIFEDADSSFTISDNGTTYTSLHSSNTCALVNYRFGVHQRGAWEFILDTDSVSDECSVFGAARQPLRSRCYSSSNDLWMRRSYNGYMYNQGSTTGNNMDKIHPGDTIRIEFNGPEGTLSYSVNGGEMEVGFTDITDDIYPACGSYRNGVIIKLIKVEIFNNQAENDGDIDIEDFVPAKFIQWSLTEPLVNMKDVTILQLNQPKDKKSKKSKKSKWLSARGNKGAAYGVHDWEFQFGSFVDGPWSIGFTFNETPVDSVRLASEKGVNGTAPRCYSWNSDGSLWSDGSKLSASFGTSFFPIKKNTTVKLRINRIDQTASFFVNGNYVGISFGPENFNPAVVLPLPEVSGSSEFRSNIIYPAASIYDAQMSIKIRSAGMESSVVLPLLASLTHSAASILGRVSARMIQGISVDVNEKDLTEWLRSAIFSGGIDSSFLDSSKLEALPANSLSELQTKISELSNDDQDSRDLTDAEKFILEIAHGYNLNQTDSSVSQFYEWLEKIDAEPVAMRKAFEKTGNYRFPNCELPFIACLIKHAGLIEEAFIVLHCIVRGESVTPSEELFLLWQKVKQLRSNLRRKRQQFKAQSVAISQTKVVDDSSSKSAADGNHDENSSDIKSSDTLSSDPLQNFHLTDSIQWLKDLELLVENQSLGAKTTVKSFGLDTKNLSIFILVDVSMTAVDKKLPTLTNGSLKIGEEAVDELLVFSEDSTATTSIALLMFDLSRIEISKILELESVTYRVGEGWDPFTVSLKGLKRKDEISEDISDFDSLCNSIAAKSQFLLLMKSAWQSTDASSKSTLLGLSSLYLQRSNSIKTKDDQSRWRTQERWKRVIEFLHVNSKIRRQLSTESESNTAAQTDITGDVSSLDAERDQIEAGKVLPLQSKEEVSTAQAAIQASSIFVNSEDSLCSAENLYRLMKTRLQRANNRIKALKILRSTINNTSIVRDPLLLFEILVVVKNCVPPNNGKKNKFSEQERSHYLINLEGCSASVLKSVQNAFASLYAGLSDIFTSYLQLWDQSSLHSIQHPLDQYSFGSIAPPHLIFQGLLMVLKMWTIQFSNRDYGWIVESSILPALFKVVSLSFHEKLVLQWFNLANSLLLLDPMALKKENLSEVKLYGKESVFNGIMNGSVTGRGLLFNLHHYALFSNHSRAELEQVGLGHSFTEGLNYINILENSSKIFCHLTSINEEKIDAVESAKKAEAAEKEAEEAKKLKEELTRLAPAGIFDPDCHATEIKLSDFNSIATLREDRSGTSICAYVSVDYDLNNPGDHGNYFELTIISVGQGDVGVGFADKKVFNVRDNMPGWIAHSYGYHGDDGKKYGEHSTPGDYPVFEEGDVIGCGIRFDTKTIFYTRNGTLLGDGFTEIEESTVTPIVGFSNRHDDTVKVKINFGVEPFVYNGSEIVTNQKALEERRNRESSASNLASTRQEESDGNKSELSRAPLETVKSIDLSVANVKDIYTKSLASLQAVESQLFEHGIIREASFLLVRYFLTLSAETHLESIEPKKETILSVHRPPLLKDVSTFGTPKAVTKVDESKIQSEISAALVHELFIGSLYVNQGRKTGGRFAHSFAFFEEKLLNYDFSDPQHDVALLEVSEVVHVLRQHLTTLCIVVGSSEDIRKELTHTNSLKTLLTLLLFPAASVYNIVVSILLKILPETDPDTVEDSMPSEWREKLNYFDSCLLDWKCGKRTRKMPDSFIRVLLLESTSIFRRGSDHLSSFGSVYGYGEEQFRKVQLNFRLLQKLFATPAWTELVAANVGNAFKNAASLMIDDDIWMAEHAHVKGGELILFYAAVSCGSIYNLPLLVPGMKVEISNSTGLVVGGFGSGNQVDVIFDANLKEFLFGKHIESVERDQIRFKTETTEIDFTTISHPVLPNLFSLTKQLLTWMLQNQANSFPQNDTLSLTKVNVLGILLSTILTLINSQTEVVMENLQDTNILKELLLLSASPINFPKIINYSDSLNLWIFTQCRRLECEDEVLELSSSKNLARQVSLSRQISAEKGRAESVDTTDLPPSDSTFVEISSEARKSTEEVAARLAEEFSFPKEFCQACLEYAMLDEVKARELLQSSKSVSFADVTETVQTKATSIASELSDESLVKGIQHVHSLSAEGYPSSDSILYYFKVEGIEGKKNDNDKEESYILEGSEEGLVKYNFTNVGMSKVTTDTSCIVTRYYNSANGNVYYKLLPKSGCSRILSFHHPLAINYKESPFPVFWTLAILSGRSLTKSLLLSGYSYILKLTEESNSSTPNNLIKFISSTDSSGIGSSLSSICNALPERNAQSASSSFGEESLITSLIEDAKKQLKDSCEVELNQQSSSEDSAKEFFRVSSPHPFRGPFQTSGEIIFPKAWRGATLSFNKKCRTPTDKARLKFYETKEDAVGDKFLYSFSGEYNPSKDFRDITFTDCKSVFYKFEVLPGGDKFPMKAKQFCGLTSYSEEVRVFKITGKVDSSKPVGLGEEDSLFNLFDLSASEQPVTEKSFATIVADSPAVSSGCWRFEVIIRSATEDLGQADHFFRVGVKEADITSDGDDFVVGDKDGTCGIGNDLATYANQQGVATSNRQINWSQDIVIDVVVEAVEENYTIAFLHDNQFINLWTGEKVGKGIIPAITFSNSCKVAVNFGDLPFRFQEFGLEEGIFSSPILPFVDSIGEEKQNDIAWGYDFVVKPLMSLNLQLNRDFELIWQPKGEESSSGSSKVDYTKRIWIWRSKSVKDYVNISDIVTTTPYPPRRSILVFKHQCKSPKSFNLVFSSSKNNLFIWRPNPEDGYVAMGDVATTSSSSPPTSCVACLPRWAVKEAEVIQSLTVFKKVGDGKTSTNASVWKVDNNYGFFFGSPYEKRTSAEPRHTDFKCDGVGSGYTLVSDVESVVSAEWRKESEILSQPSVLWSQQLIHGLLTSEKWHQMALNDSVFKALVNYLRSSTAAAPLEVVPTIILMVRQANKYSIPLSFHEMKTLCHVILKEAVDLVKTQKKTEIPKSLMRLVDLVVEIQITNVLESGLKDRSTISRNIERGKFKLDWFEETKEEVNIIEEKEGDILDNSFASTKVVSKSAKWWDRSNLDHHALKLHRVMKKDSVVHLIDGSETVLMKLKQALKFLFAVGSSENSLEHSISTPKIERSFPKLMTSKIWYETISLCQFIQSTHPYRAKNFVKKVSFPGVQQLSVQFDRRCSLNPGDKLTLSSGTHNYVLSSSMNENYLKKGVEFISNEVTITFEAGCTEKDTHEWGWAFIIFTSGPVYESADTTIDLESLVENVAGSSSANLNIKDDYSIEDAVERLKSLKLTDIDLDVTSDEPLKGNATETSEKIKKIDTNGHDSDSEESGVIDATEDGGKATSQIEVGIDSTELYQAEGELARPKSKRGRRPKVKFEEETKDKEKTVSEEKKAEEEEEVDPTLDIIEFLGQLRHSDFISVPHSKELEIKIERSTADPNPSEDSSAPTRSTDYSYLLKIIGEVEGTVTTRILLAANESRTLKVPGSTANYELFSIATERLEQIIDAIKRKAEEAKRVERGEVEKAEDIPVVEEVQVQEQVKPAAPEIDWQSLIGWNCSLCTYFNTNDHTTCEMCGTANQVLAAADPTASTVAESTTTSGEAVAGWWCPVCTLVNPLRATSCQACGTARVTGEDSTERADEKPKKDEEEELLLSPSISDIVVSKPSAISSSLTTGDIVKISVKGKFDIIGKFESRLEAAVVSGGKILTPLQVHHRLSSWNRECDEALIEYMNNHKKESTTNTTKAQPFSFILPKQYLSYQGQSLSRLTMIDIIMRTQMIEAFNKTLETLLPLIDLGNDDPHSLGAMIRKSNRYLLMKIKSPLLEKAINSTSANNATVPSSDAPATLMLDNFKSLLSRERGEKDITISQNCFVQAFKQLQKKDSAVYRYIISGDRCFTISFADESGIDAGGVFREGISRIIEDLFSEHFHLLLLCPNGQQVVHSNMDKYVPNPKYITPLALDMFEFIGKLMAMSIRAKLYLPFEFPPLIWKKIVGEEVNKYDLMEIDMITSRQLDEIEFCHKEQLNTTTTTTSENNNGLFNEPITNQETFYNKYQGKLKFVYIGSDSIEKDLILNGHLKEVTFENRFEYCDLVRKTRLNEFDVQIAAIARGMGQVIPMRALLLFSAKQLEELVCGNAKIDLDVWKQNTEVSGVSSTTVNLFWKVMESLTVQEQTGFVRFAWGRSRLPSKSEDFQMKMRLTSGGRAALPVSHTCFFSVELPEYRTEEEMRHGLLTAIHYGVGGILNG